jgi:hypothetical protein
VTDEQRSRWPIFIATLRAVDTWPFFRVARALKNSQLADGETHVGYGNGHLNQSQHDPAARDTIGVHFVPRL